MFTFRTIPPTPSGFQQVYLIPHGGLTAAYCYNSLYGPFPFNGESTGTTWTLPEYYLYDTFGLGAPIDTHGLGHENPCTHLNIKGTATTEFNDTYGDQSPYVPVGTVLVFTDTVDNIDYYQSSLAPYGSTNTKSMVRYGKNSTSSTVFTHPRLGISSSLRKSGELDGIWVKHSMGRPGWQWKEMFISDITPSSFYQEHHWVNEWIGQFGELERKETIYDLSASETVVGEDSIVVTYTGTRTYKQWSRGTLSKSTSEPYSTTCTGYISSPPLVCGPGVATVVSHLKEQILLKAGLALNACVDAISQIDVASVSCSAIESVSPLDMNNIENGVQLKEMGGFLPPVKESIQLLYDFENPKKWLKAGSSWYLWYKYCVKPTASDISTLVGNQKRVVSDLLKKPTMKYSNFRSRQDEDFTIHGFQVSTWCACNVRLRPRAYNLLANLYTKLDYIGLSPCLSNGWDLIPFSFVLDWFVNVGDALRQLDVQFLANMYDVGSCTIGRKATVALAPSEFNLPSHTTITDTFVSSYNRSVTAYFPRNEVKLGSGNPSRHILDGTALICAVW